MMSKEELEKLMQKRQKETRKKIDRYDRFIEENEHVVCLLYSLLDTYEKWLKENGIDGETKTEN